jgi:SAM-dependent methyltransferase
MRWGQSMKKGSLADSWAAHVLFRLIAPVMESPLRRRFFSPVRTLRDAGVRSGQKVLEVGPGTGFFTVPAAELVGDEGRVVAIDPHPLAIEQVARKIRDVGLTNVSLIKADATEAGLASGSIDLVLLFGVIPSATLPLDRLLPETHRLLKPEGALAVWTAFPWWSAAILTRGGLFVYVGEESGVHSFRKRNKFGGKR